MKQVTLRISERQLLPVERINRNAREHGYATAQSRFDRPVDHTRLFTCPSLAPLAHAAIFAELTPAQQRRYNQVVGLMQNELICFFEEEFAGRALPALLHGSSRMPPELSTSLGQFLEEERQHTAMFRRLNRLAEETWYATTDYHILRLPRGFLMLLRQITNRPALLPMVFWMMLLMEERSLMMSKRYAAADPDLIDLQFREAYRAHAEDEVRHVQIDWHLLEQFYRSRPDWVRGINARLFEALVAGVFLKPRRANVRLVDLLVAEFPVLRSMRGRLIQAACDLADNPGYRQMMYSPEVTPISHSLLSGLPEFAGVCRRLFTARVR